MTQEALQAFRKKAKAYSVVYALYPKEDYIITSFYNAPKGRDKPEPPYYYDIMTLSGEVVSSGELEYPILCEDEGDKVFLFVQKAGGWFEEDEIYLVGFTIQDFLEGEAEKSVIDHAIARLRQK